MEIQRSARLASRLMDWHGGQESGVYSVASRSVAGISVRYEDAGARRAVEELTAQRSYHLDHLGRGNNDAAIRADVDQLAELVAWLTGPIDTSVHLVSGVVHVYLDVVEAHGSVARAAGRIVVRDRDDDLRVWPFEDLRAPQLAGVTADEGMARAAAAAIDVMGFDCSANRAADVPIWAPPVEIADLIHDGADHDELGEVVTRATQMGEEP